MSGTSPLWSAAWKGEVRRFFPGAVLLVEHRVAEFFEGVPFVWIDLDRRANAPPVARLGEAERHAANLVGDRYFSA